MSDDFISTGNPAADNFLRKRLVDDLGLWALVSYFESKGLLNRDEFIKFLNAEAKMMVQAILTAEESEHEKE